MMPSMNSNYEEMNVAGSRSGSSRNGSYNCDIDSEDFGLLRQNYKSAVECLIQCEYVISNLEGQLASKERHITSLEEKLVQMSLELASSKAFEDEHRSTRRVSSFPVDDIIVDDMISDDDDDNVRSNPPPSPSTQKVAKKPSTNIRTQHTRGGLQRHRSWSRSLGSIGYMFNLADDDESEPFTDSSKSPLAKSMDNINTSGRSTSSRRGRRTITSDDSLSISNRISSINLSQLFRNKKAEEAFTEDGVEVAQDGDKKEESIKCASNFDSPDLDGQQRRRRPTNKHRVERLQPSCLSSSSRSVIEGVVFPKSFEEVVSKGCLDLRDSLNSVLNEEKLRLEFG